MRKIKSRATPQAATASRHRPQARLRAAAAAALLAWSPVAWLEAQALPPGYIAQAIPSGGLAWMTLANQLNDNGLVTGFVNDVAGSGSMFAWSAQTGLTLMPNAGAGWMHLNNAGLLLYADAHQQNAWTGKQLTSLAGALTVTAAPVMLQTGAGETQPFIQSLNNQGWMVGSSSSGSGSGSGAVWGSSVWRADGTRAAVLQNCAWRTSMTRAWPTDSCLAPTAARHAAWCRGARPPACSRWQRCRGRAGT